MGLCWPPGLIVVLSTSQVAWRSPATPTLIRRPGRAACWQPRQPGVTTGGCLPGCDHTPDRFGATARRSRQLPILDAGCLLGAAWRGLPAPAGVVPEARVGGTVTRSCLHRCAGRCQPAWRRA